MTSTPIAELRPAVRPPDRRTGQPRRLGGLAVRPRFDSPAVFGRLLDPAAGHWSLRPADPDAEATRRYVDETMVLETTWTTGDGHRDRRPTRSPRAPAGDPHALGARAPRLLRPRGRVHRRRGRDGRGVRPAPRVRPGGAAGHGGGGRRDRPGRRGRAGALVPRCRWTSPARPHPARLRLTAGGPAAARAAAPHDVRALARAAAGRRSSTTRCARRPTPGGRGRGCTRTTAGRGATSSTTAAGCCRRCPTSRPAPWSPPRRPRCPSRWAASATGTTATPGSATPASPWRRCGWRPAPTRPTSSSTTWRPPPPARSWAGQRPADHVRRRRRARPQPSGRCRTSPAGGTAGPSGSATAPGTSGRSTSTASCSARRTGWWPSSTRTTRATARRFLDRVRRRGRAPVAGDGPGHLGGPRGAPALPVLEAHVLGRAGPGRRPGRPLRADGPGAGWRARGRRDPRRRSSPRAGATRRSRSPSPSAPTTSTRRT